MDLVDDRVLVEVKSVEQRARAHPQAAVDVSRAHASAGWSADHLRRSDAAGRAASVRERLSVLGAFAAPRELSCGG